MHLVGVVGAQLPRVREVDPAVFAVVRVEGDGEKTSVVDVVDAIAQIGELIESAAHEDLQDSRLLRDEHAAVARIGERGRIVEAVRHRASDESDGQTGP
jgi:hypothetical protein